MSRALTLLRASKQWSIAIAFTAATTVCLAHPTIANAVLQKAAKAPKGGTVRGGEKDAVDQIAEYVDTLVNYAIIISLPLAALGLTVAGGMFMVGRRQASTVAGGVVLGMIIVVAGKGIAE